MGHTYRKHFHSTAALNPWWAQPLPSLPVQDLSIGAKDVGKGAIKPAGYGVEDELDRLVEARRRTGHTPHEL